jgi:hypothetical protein
MSYRWVRLSADKAMAFLIFVLGRASFLFCRILALWLTHPVLPLREDMMTACQTRNLTISLLVALLPMNVALAGGRGGGPQGAVGSSPLSGASGYGAAVGGGAPAGAVGGGPPAGLIGGGVAPTNTNPTSSSGATTEGPAVGGVPGASTGVSSAPNAPGGGLPPSLLSKTGNSGSAETERPQGAVAPKSVEGGAATSQDAVSTQIVAPRPCGVAAHETDGFTTCIGILPSGHERSGRARGHTGDMRRHAHMARS